MWLLAVLCLTLWSVVAPADPSSDPCSSPIVLDGSPRQQQIKTDLTNPGIIPLCDDHLAPGWYRFKEGTGEVSMKMVEKDHCGADSTVWMRGDIPSAGQLVNRTFCFNHLTGSLDGCLWSEETLVKNCGGFLVYRFPLKSLTLCPMVVCTDPSIQRCPIGEVSLTGFKPCTKIPCPKGMWSKDGYEPCFKESPDLNKVILTGPKRINKGYCNICHIDSPETADDAMFHVTWYSDNTTIKQEELTFNIRDACFNITDWEGHINTELSCHVYSYFKSRPNHTSPEQISNSFFGGIKMFPSSLTVLEGHEESVELISTLPVDCKHPGPCQLKLQLEAEYMYLNQCEVTLTPASWNHSSEEIRIPLEVSSVLDQVFKPDYNSHLKVTIAPDQATPSYWEIATLSPYPVTIKDRPWKTCVSAGDPRFYRSFSQSSTYNLYHLGDFNLASDTRAPIAVQIETNVWHITHLPMITAVAIQTGNDVTIFDTFGGSKMVSVYTIGSMTSRSIFTCGTDEYRITMQSGHTVSIFSRQQKSDNYYLDVKVSFPDGAVPIHNGVLDTCDVNPTFTGANPFGKLHEIKADIIDTFRVPPGGNLFKGEKLSLPIVADKSYCDCRAASSDIRSACLKSMDAGSNTLKSCKEFKPKRWTGQFSQNRPGHQDFKDYQPMVHTWPTLSGIHETEARTHCRKAIRDYTPAPCATLPGLNLDEFVQGCADDVLASNGYEYVISTVEAYWAICEVDLRAKTQTYSNPALSEIIYQPCPNLCNLHGACVKGVCQCEAGWSYVDCSVNTGEPFTIAGINGGITCDKSLADDCFEPLLQVDNLGHIDSVTEEHYFYKNGRPSPLANSHSANITRVNVHIVRFALDKQDTYAQLYKFAINSRSHSASIDYLVYDGRCQMCHEDLTCFQREDYCLIDDKCYHHGSVNPKNPSQVCNASGDLSKWSQKQTSTGMILG